MIKHDKMFLKAPMIRLYRLGNVQKEPEIICKSLAIKIQRLESVQNEKELILMKW